MDPAGLAAAAVARINALLAQRAQQPQMPIVPQAAMMMQQPQYAQYQSPVFQQQQQYAAYQYAAAAHPMTAHAAAPAIPVSAPSAVGGIDIAAAVAHARAAANRLNSLLGSGVAPGAAFAAVSPLTAAPAQAAAAHHSTATNADGEQPMWPWAKSSTDQSGAPAVPEEGRMGADGSEYDALLQLTMKGLKKVGYKGGPILSEREASGIKYGLHRANFAQAVVRTVKLLVGVEAALASTVNFPLLASLCGQYNMNLLHIMKACPGVVVAVQGVGSQIGGDEPLHVRITGSEHKELDSAKVLADHLVMTIRQQFEAARIAFNTTHGAARPVAAVADLLAYKPSAAASAAAVTISQDTLASFPYAALEQLSAQGSAAAAASSDSLKRKRDGSDDASSNDDELGRGGDERSKRVKAEADGAPAAAHAASASAPAKAAYDPFADVDSD